MTQRGFFIKLLIAAAMALFAMPLRAWASDKLGVAIPYPVYTISPLALRDPVVRILLSNISYGLTKITMDGDSAVEVVQSFQRSPDAKLWTFALRSDVAFSSGAPTTAEEIQASFQFFKTQAAAKNFATVEQVQSPLEHSALKQTKSPSEEESSSLPFSFSTHFKIPTEPRVEIENEDPVIPTQLIRKLQNIREISVDRPETSYYFQDALQVNLKFALDQADPDFDVWVAPLGIINQKVARQFGRHFGKGTFFSGLGPYQIRENRPEQGVLLETTNNFYLPALPRTAVIDFQYFPDAQSALSALRVGAVDIIALPTHGQLQALKEDPTLVAIKSPLVNLSQITGPWKLPKNFWSEGGNDSDRLLTSQIIVRKSLSLDNEALARFDLRGTFLP